MARYKPDHKSFGRFILSEQARRPVVEVAQEIAQRAAMRAPRSKGPGPHLADNYKVNRKTAPVSTGDSGKPLPGGPRVGAEVYNDVQRPGEEKSYAAASENGKRGSEGHRTLGKVGAEFHVPKGVR